MLLIFLQSMTPVLKTNAYLTLTGKEVGSGFDNLCMEVLVADSLHSVAPMSTAARVC